MPDLAAPDYQFARLIIERGLAALYVFAFVVAYVQFPALPFAIELEKVK